MQGDGTLSQRLPEATCQQGTATDKREGRPAVREKLSRPDASPSSSFPLTSRPAALVAEAPHAANGATVQQLNSVLSAAVGRSSTIVARGQIDGARCVDMLIDTGASCCFVRRSSAERMKLKSVSLGQQVTVTLADRRTTVATHEVLVGSLCVHGRRAACSLLVMDELSNDVIVGLNWQRAAGLIIRPGHPHDLLNGQPVHREVRKSAQAGDVSVVVC